MERTKGGDRLEGKAEGSIRLGKPRSVVKAL